MATATNRNVNDTSTTDTSTGTTTGSTVTGIGSPISNEAYNVIRALAAKLEGLEAYRKYSKDGDPELWKQLTDVECQGVKHLCGELERIVKAGKLQMREPGKAS
jgi:hypothetical protein